MEARVRSVSARHWTMQQQQAEQPKCIMHDVHYQHPIQLPTRRHARVSVPKRHCPAQIAVG